MINIFEYINDYFAFPKQHILTNSKFRVETIHDHLIKLKLYENCRDIDHWKKEIISYLIKIQEPKIKGNIKVKPSKYFEILFDHPVEPKKPYHDSYLRKVITRLLEDDDYENEYSKYRAENKSKVNTKLIDSLYDNIKKFMRVISFHMSKRDLTKEIIRQELDKYIENIRDS